MHTVPISHIPNGEKRMMTTTTTTTTTTRTTMMMMMMMMTRTTTATTKTDLLLRSLCRPVFLGIHSRHHYHCHPKRHICYYHDHRSHHHHHHHLLSLGVSRRAGGIMTKSEEKKKKKKKKKKKRNSILFSQLKGCGNDFFIRSRLVHTHMWRIVGYSMFTLIPRQLVYMNR
jgi:hypothetical protein